jgi:NADH-quinone oxidoreductase subunit J
MSGVQALFYVFAAATCLGAIAVVVSQNVVRMAFWLMISLCSISGLFFLLRADFVAAVQLMIYVGGTVVLLVFGVMLTASGRHAKIKTSPAEGFLAAGIGSLFLTMIISTVASVDWEANNAKFDPQYAALKAVVDSDECFKDGASLAKADIPEEHRSHLDPIYKSVDATELSRSELLTAYDGYQQDDAGNTARPIGLALLGVRPDKDLNKKTESLSIGYLLPFEIASIHLLVVLIGAAYLARAKRRSDSVEES